MMKLRHITSAEVLHQQKEIDKTSTRKRRKGTLTDREKEIGIFSMMGFDSATSSFLALLVNKS